MSNLIYLQKVANEIVKQSYHSKRSCGKEHIPIYMMNDKEEYSGFFFGITRFHSYYLYGNNEYYIVKPSNMDGHILILGRAGSGKSSCIVIPTMERWVKCYNKVVTVVANEI